MACADLALDPEVVALQRMVLQESGQFPDLAANVLQKRHRPHRHGARGLAARSGQASAIELDDVEEAAGMLIGMMASAPQRAAIYAS